MAILDFWGNPLGTATVVAIGYRGEHETFPHDLYSFLLSSVRDADQKDVALLYRWMRPMQQFWEQQYSAIYSLYNLYSPEDCATELLDHLRKNIGILDDLSYLWGVMTETEQRRLIKYFIQFLMYRGTDYGVHEIIQTMTGYPAELRGYFFYRWLLSGDTEYAMETAIGREDEDNDPWLISEYNVPLGQQPDSISILTNPTTGDDYYYMDVSALVALVVNPPVPDVVIVRCRLTGQSIHAHLRESAGVYHLILADNYFFGQSEDSPSTTLSDFTIGFEIDQYVSDILVVDDGTINREMLKGLARFSRPISERFYLRYYNLIEDFTSRDRWDVISGDMTHDPEDKSITLDGAALSVVQLDYLDCDNWSDYCLMVRATATVPGRYSEIRFMYQDTDNYYWFRFTPSAPPAWPAGTWDLVSISGGAINLLAIGNTEYLDPINYVWRIECFTSARPAGDVQVIRVYQDENLLTEWVDSPVLWAPTAGTVQLVQEANGELIVDKVHCHPIPLEYDFVGPTV